MEGKLYLDWEGLQQYDQQIKQELGTWRLTFTKNGNEVSSFSVNDSNKTIEILSDQDILNIINYGQSDISNLSPEELNVQIFSQVSKSGSYNDLLDVPTKLSQFENDQEFVSEEQLTSILGYDIHNNKTIQDILDESLIPITHGNKGETLDSEKQVDSLFI